MFAADGWCNFLYAREVQSKNEHIFIDLWTSWDEKPLLLWKNFESKMCLHKQNDKIKTKTWLLVARNFSIDSTINAHSTSHLFHFWYHFLTLVQSLFSLHQLLRSDRQLMLHLLHRGSRPFHRTISNTAIATNWARSRSDHPCTRGRLRPRWGSCYRAVVDLCLSLNTCSTRPPVFICQ